MSENFYPQNQAYFNNMTKSKRNNNQITSSRKENVNHSLSRDINSSRNDSQRGTTQSNTQLLQKISFLQQQLQKIMKVLSEENRNNSDFERLTKQNSQLKSQLKMLQESNKSLQQRLAQEQQAHSLLESQIQQLKQQNIDGNKSTELESKIIKLNEQIQELLQKIQSISGQNEELKYLQSQLEDMEVLKEENFYLKKQIQNLNEVTYHQERKLKLELDALKKEASYTERKAAQQELVSELQQIIQEKDAKIQNLQRQHRSKEDLVLLKQRIKILQGQLENCQKYMEIQSQKSLQEFHRSPSPINRQNKFDAHSKNKGQILHEQTISFGQIPYSSCKQHLQQINSLQRTIREKDDTMEIMNAKNQQIVRQLKIQNNYHKENVKKLQEDLANIRMNWKQKNDSKINLQYRLNENYQNLRKEIQEIKFNKEKVTNLRWPSYIERQYCKQQQSLNQQINLLTKRLERANEDIFQLKQCVDRCMDQNGFTPREPPTIIKRAIWLLQTLTSQRKNRYNLHHNDKSFQSKYHDKYNNSRNIRPKPQNQFPYQKAYNNSTKQLHLTNKSQYKKNQYLSAFALQSEQIKRQRKKLLQKMKEEVKNMGEKQSSNF